MAQGWLWPKVTQPLLSVLTENEGRRARTSRMDSAAKSRFRDTYVCVLFIIVITPRHLVKHDGAQTIMSSYERSLLLAEFILE